MPLCAYRIWMRVVRHVGSSRWLVIACQTFAPMLPIDPSAINVPSSSLATFNPIQHLFRVFGGLERLKFHLPVRANTAPIANEHDLTKQCRLQTEFVKPPHVAAVINATQIEWFSFLVRQRANHIISPK